VLLMPSLLAAAKYRQLVGIIDRSPQLVRPQRMKKNLLAGIITDTTREQQI